MDSRQTETTDQRKLHDVPSIGVAASDLLWRAGSCATLCLPLAGRVPHSVSVCQRQIFLQIFDPLSLTAEFALCR
jgi:hypothetical protein